MLHYSTFSNVFPHNGQDLHALPICILYNIIFSKCISQAMFFSSTKKYCAFQAQECTKYEMSLHFQSNQNFTRMATSVV